MTRRRFYAPPESFAPDGLQVTLSPEETRHLRDVLRLRAGDEARVFDGVGREFACVVADEGARAPRGPCARLEVRAPVEPPSPESSLDLTLAVALLKGEKFDLVVQKGTELGVSRVVPIVTKRADVRLRDGREAASRLARWRRLALEAAKQSGRARLPVVETPVPVTSLLSRSPRADELRLMFAERGGIGLEELQADSDPRPQAVAALVGPEGGWADEEIEDGAARGWRVVTLGGRVLRAETAAVAAAVLVQHLYGDLK